MRLKIKVKLRIKGGVKCVLRGDLWTETTVTETEKFHENFIRSVTFPLYKSVLPFLLLFNAVDRAGSLFFFIERCNESPVSSTKRITDKFNRAESPNSLNLNLWHCLDASGGKKKSPLQAGEDKNNRLKTYRPVMIEIAHKVLGK